MLPRRRGCGVRDWRVFCIDAFVVVGLMVLDRRLRRLLGENHSKWSIVVPALSHYAVVFNFYCNRSPRIMLSPVNILPDTKDETGSQLTWS